MTDLNYGILMLCFMLLWSGPSLPLDETVYATEYWKYIICLEQGLTAQSLPFTSETQEDLDSWMWSECILLYKMNMAFRG